MLIFIHVFLQSLKLLWAQHKGSGAFRAIVAQEFERALADLSTDKVMKHEAEVSQTPPYCKKKKRTKKVYAVRRHDGSLCLRRPWMSDPTASYFQLVDTIVSITILSHYA